MNEETIDALFSQYCDVRPENSGEPAISKSAFKAMMKKLKRQKYAVVIDGLGNIQQYALNRYSMGIVKDEHHNGDLIRELKQARDRLRINSPENLSLSADMKLLLKTLETFVLEFDNIIKKEDSI